MLDELFPQAAFTQLPGVPSSVTALAEIGQVPPLVAALVAIIGVAAAANALVLTVRRRGGDLAVLRALGLRPRDVRRAVGWQAATMAAIAAIAGVPVGVVLGRFVWTGIARPANVLIRVDVGPGRPRPPARGVAGHPPRPRHLARAPGGTATPSRGAAERMM